MAARKSCLPPVSRRRRGLPQAIQNRYCRTKPTVGAPIAFSSGRADTIATRVLCPEAWRRPSRRARIARSKSSAWKRVCDGKR